MKKKILSTLLALSMMLSLAPSATFAANIDESKSTLLGTEAEFQTTLNTFFDENGLRKVSVGWNSNAGALNKKYGIVDKSGNFVVEPVYDEISLFANHEIIGASGSATLLPVNFIGGYTQAVRDGKMGLLNIKGEEVIPCKYDFVGLPAEGVCRVLNKKDDKTYYLGYWNLEQNKEIVAPNQYVTTYKNKRIGSITDNFSYSKKKPAGDYLAYHDFSDGYAMVFEDKDLNDYPYATVIDKNGKNIYGASYLINNQVDDFKKYPQKGPYLCFMEPKTFPDYHFQKTDNPSWQLTQTFNTYCTGLVGPNGVSIAPTYTAGVLASPGEASFYIGAASFQIILDKGLVLAQKDAKPGYLYGGAYGVLDLNGNVVLPFTHGVNQELHYQEKDQVFTTLTGGLYDISGKLIVDTSYDYSFFVNGFSKVLANQFNNTTKEHEFRMCMGKADGSLLDITTMFNLSLRAQGMDRLSDASTTGYFWLQNAEGKWGLLDFSGKAILPFQYDAVDYGSWTVGENGFASVTQNGKVGMVNVQGVQVLPCEYSGIKKIDINAPNVTIIGQDKKRGLAEVKTGKILIPAQYDKILAFNALKQENKTGFGMGVCYAEKDGKMLLLDPSGNIVFSTTSKFNEAVGGLYTSNGDDGTFDSRGRVIITKEQQRTRNPELGGSYTIYVKGGNIYQVSANYIESTYKFNSPHEVASEEYAQKKKEEAMAAATQAGANPYQAKPIYKESFIKFISVPSKVLYNVGEPFEIAGFEVANMAVDGTKTNVVADIELKVGSTKIYDGYKFQSEGEKTVVCYYKGENLNSFKISVVSEDSNLLADGKYTISVYGKYLRLVGTSPNDWMELQDTKPAQVFTVKLIRVDKEKGPLYTIMTEDGRYVKQDSSREGVQLRAGGIPHQWRINQYSSFCTIRDYGKQKLLVNASGQQSKNGTKVIVWTHTGKAPDNAKLKFTKVN